MKKFLLLALMLPSLAFGHGAPVIWDGTAARWLPGGLKSAGMCVMSSTGVMTSGTVNLASATYVTGVLPNANTTATASAGNSTIVARDGSGNFAAGTITAALSGNASTSSALAANPADCPANEVARAIAANGDLTCSALVSGDLPAIAHSSTTGLTSGDDHTQYALLAGRAGGQTLKGGTGSADPLILTSTNHATKGKVTVGTTLTVDEANARVGIGIASPTYRFHHEATADDYSHGAAFSHSLGGANSLWRFYPDLNGTFSLYNPAQATVAFVISATVQQLMLANGQAVGGAVNIRPQTGQVGHHTLVLQNLASQTGDAFRHFASDGSTVNSKIDEDGDATFKSVTAAGGFVGNASTATALAANGANCSGNNFAIGVDASGVCEGAQPAFSNLSGSVAASQMPALTGDITTSAGAVATTLATVNGNVGSFTNADITVNAKGLVTAAANGVVNLASGEVSGILPAANLPAPTTSAISASDVDWSTLKNVDGLYTKTLSANTTLTWSNVTAGQTIVIAITNTASNYTLTWPAAAKWGGGSAPTQTVGAKTDVYTCKAYDSTNAYCSAVQNY